MTKPILGAGVTMALLAGSMGCQKHWQYKSVTGDDRTLEVYTTHGWEMVTRDRQKDGYDYVFRRSDDESVGDIDAETKEDTRWIDKQFKEAMATPTPEPKWQRDYEAQMQALNEKERQEERNIDANEKLMEAYKELLDAQIDARTDLDDAGKDVAKARAADYLSKLQAQSGGVLIRTGTLPNGSSF